MLVLLIAPLLAALSPVTEAVAGRYVLPSVEDRLASQRRPVVEKDLAHYFQPSSTGGQLMSDIFTGLLPQPAFEVQQAQAALPTDPTQAFLNSLVSQGILQPSRPGVGVPPQARSNPFDITVPRKPGEKSTSGIPDIDPSELNLPSYPGPVSGFSSFPRGGRPPPAAKPVLGPQGSLSNLPSIPDGPPPPPSGGSPFGSGPPGSFGSGGFGSGGSFGSAPFPGDSDSAAGIPIETGPPPDVPGPQRLMTDLANLIGIGDLVKPGGIGGIGGAQATPQVPAPLPNLAAPFQDIAAFGPINTLLDSLSGAGPASALTGIIPSAIYEGFAARSRANGTDGNGTSDAVPALSEKSLKKNLGLIQELIMQPNSPFCNPKPQPLATFNIDAFMGTWFQVLYSPPMSSGPCSMITYRKMDEKGSGGAGTLISTFEYTTEGGGGRGKPEISSGFALLRGPGQLIYKTRNSRSDVNVQVVEAGPVNGEGLYEWVVLSVNCNYPIHVFARDPVVYNQKYAAGVNAMLQQRGLVDGFKRLLNIVAPVDHSLCRFPKALFGPASTGLHSFR